MDHINDTTTLDHATAYIIYRSARLLRYHLNSFLQRAEVNISVEQWFILFRLHEQDGRSQSELADQKLGDYPNITRLVDGLQKRGLVSRQRDAQDRRKQLIYLTSAGQELLSILLPLVVEERKKVFAGISDEEIAQLADVLKRIENNLFAA